MPLCRFRNSDSIRKRNIKRIWKRHCKNGD